MYFKKFFWVTLSILLGISILAPFVHAGSKESPSIEGEKSEPVLHRAIRAWDLEKTEALLKNEAKVDELDENGNTTLLVLMDVIQKRTEKTNKARDFQKSRQDFSTYQKFLNLLFAYKADPFQKNKSGKSAFTYTVSTSPLFYLGELTRYPALSELILYGIAHGFNIYSVNSNGNSPISELDAKTRIDLENMLCEKLWGYYLNMESPFNENHLHLAARLGNSGLVAHAIARGSKFSPGSHSRKTALAAALSGRNGDVNKRIEMATGLLKVGAKIKNVGKDFPVELLHALALAGMSTRLERELKKSPFDFASQLGGKTLLDRAFESGDLKTAEIILYASLPDNRRLSLDSESIKEKSLDEPFLKHSKFDEQDEAIYSNYQPVIRFLVRNFDRLTPRFIQLALKNGIDFYHMVLQLQFFQLNSNDSNFRALKWTVMMHRLRPALRRQIDAAMGFPLSKPILEIITQYYIPGIDDPGLDSMPPLHSVIGRKDLASVRLLLESKADPNALCLGETPLGRAIILTDFEMIRSLLNANAGINAVTREQLNDYYRVRPVDDNTAQGGYNYTPLMLASWTGKVDVAKVLIEYKADVNEKASEAAGGTALGLAATGYSSDMLQFLLKQKADINLASYDKRTPVHLATFVGRKDAVSTLLAAKANFELADGEGITPLYSAVRGGQHSISKSLMDRKANPFRPAHSLIRAAVEADEGPNGASDMMESLVREYQEEYREKHRLQSRSRIAAENPEKDEKGVQRNFTVNGTTTHRSSDD